MRKGPTELGLQMRKFGCRPTREGIPTNDGTPRQVRGYHTADIRTAATAIQPSNTPMADADDQ